MSGSFVSPAFVTRVKLAMYERIVESGAPPHGRDLAALLAVSPARIGAALAELARVHLIVLEPDDAMAIRMALPFSGVATDFLVTVGARRYYANCGWDALGIAAALHKDAHIATSDPHTGEPLTLAVTDGALVWRPLFSSSGRKRQSRPGAAPATCPCARW